MKMYCLAAIAAYPINPTSFASWLVCENSPFTAGLTIEMRTKWSVKSQKRMQTFGGVCHADYQQVVGIACNCSMVSPLT